MKCNILLSKDKGSGQINIGSITLVGDTLKTDMKTGYERIMRSILREPVLVNMGKTIVDRNADPEKWLRALPENYTGSRLRAQFIGD